MNDPNRRPKTLDEFGCWLNCWADEERHTHYDRRQRRAYERAVADVFREFEKLHPGWMVAWEDWEGLKRPSAGGSS